MKNVSETLVRQSIIPWECITFAGLMLSLTRTLPRRDYVYPVEPCIGSTGALRFLPERGAVL